MKKENKEIIARNGFTKDLDFGNNQNLIFKTWNPKKKRITPFGVKKMKWIADRFGSKEIALCYCDHDGTTLIVEVE